jgi:hypothetical protein
MPAIKQETGSMGRRRFLATTGAPAAIALAPPGMEAQAQEGYASLFDGHTLAGWVIEEGPESSFFVQDGAVVAHPSASSPTWLRSERQYENFDLLGEFFIKGWMDSGVCFHAPEHGRITQTGLQMKVFANPDPTPQPHSMGAIFPVVAPRKINVRQGWNQFRILMDWPQLRIWTNGELIHDLDVESTPELRYRLRQGYFGLTTTSYPCPFRNLKVRELPAKEKWLTLYEDAGDLANWVVTSGDPHIEALGEVLRADGLGDFGTKALFRDFELQTYVRGCRVHNGGIQFRCAGQGAQRKLYEIQLHDVEEAHFPTGSLYHYKRALYPRIEPEKWFFLQLVVKDRYCMVRINGDSVLEYEKLDHLEEGRIELQAHTRNRWLEYKHIRIKRI